MVTIYVGKINDIELHKRIGSSCCMLHLHDQNLSETDSAKYLYKSHTQGKYDKRAVTSAGWTIRYIYVSMRSAHIT